MLKSLYIKNYAIIDELEIDFNSHFNVFTGETGAGKSIIIGALSYLIRGKADPSIIKTGQDKAIVEGVFTIADYMKKPLDEAEIPYDDELIVRRIISNDGHNSIKINQTTVTLNFLISLFDEHIDIHSQKDSQYLLNKKNHLVLLDKYCLIDDLLEKYSKLYEQYRIAFDKYNNLINNTYNESELDFYKFDYKELNDADLSVEEENELQNKEKRFKLAEKYLTTINNAITIYDGDNGIKEHLTLLLKQLNSDDEQINGIKEAIENSYYSIDEQVSNLKDIYSSFTEDDLDIDKIEERLYLYSKLKRKHNTDTAGLILKLDDLKTKIQFFENKDVVIADAKKKMQTAYDECLKAAALIHNTRVMKAKDLEKLIFNQTQDLMLNNVDFKVVFTELKDLNATGMDNVEFFICFNKGEELKPLKDVASGGEISRLMLALKTIFTSLSETSLVVFDEIDTGVSGKVAFAIGQKMATISGNTQVICITHLAPVAAFGTCHFYIFKKDVDGKTVTNVKLLDENQTIAELAFMSSADNSKESLAAAKLLYDNAQEKSLKL